MAEPVSIRYNNPGAMWGGKRAEKWGATDDVVLHDGLGQGNRAAVFPTKVQGAAAQFDLWKDSYSGMTFGMAIRKWSGGNSSPAYAAFLTNKTGIAMNDVVTRDLLAGPKGIALLKAQAAWEAGKPYPMTDAEWQTAQSMVFKWAIPAPPDIPKPEQPEPPKPTSTTKKAGGSVVAGGAAAGAAHQAGLSLVWIIAIGIAVAVTAFIIWKLKK